MGGDNRNTVIMVLALIVAGLVAYFIYESQQADIEINLPEIGQTMPAIGPSVG